MGNLDLARSAIDEIDRQMARLFERRMEAVEMISDEKKILGLPIVDEKRRKIMLEKNSEFIENPEYAESYTDFLSAVIGISEKYQLKRIGIDRLFEKESEKPICETLIDDKAKQPIKNQAASNSIPDNIVIKRGALDNPAEIINLDRKVLIVSDDNVPDEYSDAVYSLCTEPYMMVFSDGETIKTPDSHREILNMLLEEGFSKSDAVIALGDDRVCDVAGYAAATYMCGIDFYTVPTTLSCFINSSVSDKNAVDSMGKKDIFGTYYKSDKTIIDPEILGTLPQRYFTDGFAEAIRIGLIFDEDLFDIFEHGDPYREIDTIIMKCVALKCKISDSDRENQNNSAAVKFGNTIGSGIERVMGYPGGLTRGECIAVGILAAVSPVIRDRLIDIYNRLGLPTQVICEPETIYAAVIADQNPDNNGMDMVFCDKIGSFETQHLTFSEIRALIYSEFGE